jgi:hypothetical protein
MGCERYKVDLIDAALGTPVSPDLERHLALCVACRSRLENDVRLIEEADRSLRDALRVEPSPGLEARLLVAARRAPRASSRSWPRVPAWTPALAAALGFLLVAGWVVWESQQAAPSPRRAAVASPTPAPAPSERAPVMAASPRIVAMPPRAPVRLGLSPREPEVLVPHGREQALAQFVVMLRDARVEPPKALTEATDPEALLPELEPLEILDLEPIAPSETVLRDGRSES